MTYYEYYRVHTDELISIDDMALAYGYDPERMAEIIREAEMKQISGEVVRNCYTTNIQIPVGKFWFSVGRMADNRYLLEPGNPAPRFWFPAEMQVIWLDYDEKNDIYYIDDGQDYSEDKFNY